MFRLQFLPKLCLEGELGLFVLDRQERVRPIHLDAPRCGTVVPTDHFPFLFRAAISARALFITLSIVTGLPSAFLLSSAATMNATRLIVSSAGTGGLPVRKNVPTSRTSPWQLPPSLSSLALSPVTFALLFPF